MSDRNFRLHKSQVCNREAIYVPVSRAWKQPLQLGLIRANIFLTEVLFSKMLKLYPLQVCVLQLSLTFDLPVDILVLVHSLVMKINRMSRLKRPLYNTQCVAVFLCETEKK